MPHRTIAIGDIHGCSAALAGLIEAIEPGPDDTLVTLGDYRINRGSGQRRGVLNLLIDLGRRCRLVPLLGNHDELLLGLRASGESLALLIAMGGAATLDSYGTGRNLDLIPEDHFAFLRSCSSFHETPSHIFIHANYVPELPMAEQPGPMLRWESLRNSIPGPHHSGKMVVAGHSSQKRGEILDLGYLKCIDTYCFGGGWLTAFDVDTARVWQVNRHGFRRRG